MPTLTRLPLIGLIGALALAGCNQPGEEVANNSAADTGMLDDNALAADDMALIESEAMADDDAVDVADLPPPPASAPVADTAPLTEAEAIEAEIDRGTGIERVRYGDGWAWTRGGRILRTADRDGRNVDYFRPGEDRPFFVQRGERAWAYDQGRPTREYDRRGRATVPDDNRRREAEQAERGARDRRDQAQRAREQAERTRNRTPGRADAWPGRPTPAASPSPTPTPRARRDRDDDRRDRATPRPTPSPTATPPPWPGRDGDRRERDRRDDQRPGE